MDGRPRNYPNGLGGARRPSNETRRPPGAPGGPPSTGSSSSTPSGMSRAERFDDERRRITESLFNKLDDSGQLQESYITHIRVQEDANYPQSPPPPTATTSSKKPRIIIISVRSTGRVKLHKARENGNGTFSIGKSWPMEDLTAIENYVHMNPINEDEAQRKMWAGEKGFTVTISKPYYWEAGTSKEKEFFIGSMVKIYNKYTRGDFPILTGFSVSELNSLTNGQPHLATAEARSLATAGRNGGGGMPSPGPSPNLSMSSPRPTPPPGSGPTPPFMKRRPDGPMSPPEDARAPMDRSDPSRNKFFNPNPGTAEARRPGDGPRRPPGARPGTGDASRAPPPFSPVLSSSPGQSPIPGGPPGRPGPPPGMRMRPSQENMNLRSKPSFDQMAPPMPVPRLTPKSSRADLTAPPKTPESINSANIPPIPSPRQRPQADDARSQRSQRSIEEQPAFDGAGLGISPAEQRKPNGLSSRRDPSPRGLRPGTAQSNASSNFARNDDVPPEEPPQRRRPLMDARPSQTSQRSVGSQGSDAPSQSPQPPMPIPPRRRPQELPKAAPVDDQPSVRGGANDIGRRETPPLATKNIPPPSSPLPQIPQPSDQKAAPEPVSPAGEEPKPTDSPVSPLEEKDTEVAHRPGLGPMIKKDMGRVGAASAFRKAAAAAGAFKPRAGGAAAKLFAKETKTSDEPDGVSGVFVPQRPTPKEEVEKKLEPEVKPTPTPDRSSRDRPTIDTETVPAVTVSSPLEPTPAVTAPPELEERLASRSPSPERPAPKAEAEAEVRRKRRRSNQQIVNISKLGIDPATLDEQGLEFEKLLGEFGWGSSELSVKSIETLESDIRREIARVEAGSWLNHLEQKDDRVDTVEKMLDRAIAECDELEGLLTLYNVELSSLNDDIAFIEAQSQGLQVQTANQRLLQHELQQLVDTISITPDQLEPLRRAPIGKVNGLLAIEGSLVLLYKALVTIDPAFVAGSRSSTVEDLNKIAGGAGFGNSELATMQALQEKKERYLSEGASFLDRLKKHMEITFGAAFMETRDALKNVDQTAMPSTKTNIDAHDVGRSTLWMLSPVVLFAKEIDRKSWDELLRMYQTQAGQLYQTEIRDNIMSWKRFARRPTGEEQDLLFTTQEKEPESITGAARKLTVKRSQTLARGLRSASGDKEGKANKVQDGKLYAFDVFAKILDDIGPVLLTEQNFVTEFFHATSTDSVDFPEAVKIAAPEDRRGPDLWLRKQFEADRAMAKRVAEVMEDIFSFWPTEVQNLVDWAVNADPLQGVGILCAVDRKLLDIEDSNQDFLTRNLQKIHERLTSLFTRFVDEQIRAIEDTKVKIKKRKGVIGFMKTFPHFAIAIENMLPASDVGEQLEIRRMVDDAYQKINKAMFESLKVIAKESPAVMATQGQGDPEDKEALNYHILLIENMNHYMEEVDGRTDSVLLDWKTRAQDEMKEHMDLYVDAVIRRPLGKLLEFIESTETFLSAPGASPQSVSQRSSHSRSVFKKLVNSHDAKEIRKGIESLKKRVDKHFGDADDPSISRDLVFKVLKECEKKYNEVCDRTVRISQDVYTGEVEMDWGTNEVTAAFRR